LEARRHRRASFTNGFLPKANFYQSTPQAMIYQHSPPTAATHQPIKKTASILVLSIFTVIPFDAVKAIALVLSEERPGVAAFSPPDVDLVFNASTQQVSVAFCPYNSPQIIQVASKTGSTWSYSTAYTTPASQRNLDGFSLASNGSGLGLALVDRSNNAVVVSSYNGTSWSASNIIAGGSNEFSSPYLAYNASGVRQLMYYQDDGLLRYGNGSESVSFTGTLALPTPILIDPANGRPVFTHVKDSAGSLYIQRQGASATSWSGQLIQASSGFPNFNGLGASIAFGADGHPRVAFIETATKQLRLATYNGTSWSVAVLGTLPVANFVSKTKLVVGPGGVLYVGVLTQDFSLSANPISLWRNPGGVWEIQQIGLTPAEKFGMATDGQKLWIAYTLNSLSNNLVLASTVMPPPPAAEISISNMGGPAVTDGGNSDFGNVATGQSVERAFTIANTGNLALTGLSINIDGPDAAKYTVIQAPTAPVAPAGSTNFVIRFTPANSGAKTAVLHLASNDADENPFDITLTGSGATAVEVFNNAIAANSGLTGADALPAATPFNDGVENLLKYAFNMNLSGPDLRRLEPGTGSSGLPSVSLGETGGEPVLRVQFLRRKGSGLIYTPKVSATLDSFSPMTGAATVTSINDAWERVSVEQPCDTATTPQCFGIVEVTIP
jgi:hypothetical protein